MATKALTIKTLFTAVNKITGPIKKMGSQITAWRNKTTKNFKKAKMASNSFGASLGKLRGVIGVLAGGAAIRKLATGINSFATAGDEIAKTSRQIGIGAEALQELRFAADRQGVSSNTLTKSMIKMNKRIGDAKNGTGILASKLKKTNPELLKQIKNVGSSEEAFNLLLKELNNIPNQMQKAAFAQAAFGKTGIDLIKLAEAGADGIAGLREESKKYGVISEDAAKDSELFVDSLTNLKAASKGVKTDILSNLLKPLTSVIAKIGEFIANNRKLIASKIGDFLRKAGEVFKKLKPPIVAVIQGIKELFAAVMTVAQTAFKMFFKEGTNAGDLLTSLINVFNIIAAAVSAFAAGINLLAPILGPILAIWAAWTVAQWALNAAMAANPLGLIIIGIVAAITAIGLLVKNWDKVKAVIIAGAKKVGEFFIFIWDKIKAAAAAVWEGMKTGFMVAVGFIKKIFFSFADVLITIYGGVAKAIIGVAAKIGDALGLNVSGLEAQIGKIEGLQSTIREKARAPILPQSPQTAQIETTRTNNASVDVNINNNTPFQVGAQQSQPSPNVGVNLGRPPILAPGT